MGALGGNAIKVCQIGRVEEFAVVRQRGIVFFFKHPPIFAKHLVALLVVLAVFGHLVDKKQRQGFDAHVEVLLFLFKVGDNRFADLHAAHILLGNVANHIALANDKTIAERHRARNGVDFRNGEALVLLHLVGSIIEVVANAQHAEFAVDGLFVGDLQLQTHLRRFSGIEQYTLHIEIPIRAAKVLHLKALDLNALDQPLVVSIQRVQHIDEIVMPYMGGGIV